VLQQTPKGLATALFEYPPEDCQFVESIALLVPETAPVLFAPGKRAPTLPLDALTLYTPFPYREPETDAEPDNPFTRASEIGGNSARNVYVLAGPGGGGAF
jgi:hypothetical protein